jgi:hypothetical protein
MFLSAQFLQGVDITRKTILLGAYHQAANLLKQETEILDALHEIRTGSRTDRRTTRFRGEMKRFGRKYGELNEIAHPTSEAIVELLASKIDGDKVDPTIEIIFKEELCVNFFGYHSLLVAKFSEELRKALTTTIGVDQTEEVAGLLVDAIETLKSQGAFGIREKDDG